MDSLDTYIEVRTIKDTSTKHISVVYDEIRNLYFLKKVLTNYNIDVWKKLQALHLKRTPEILELKEENGTLTIIEQYINAPTLDIVLENITLTQKEKVDIILQLCDLLEILHKQKPPIIHRDIKPENIVYQDGVIYLLDFDIARNYIKDQSTDTKLMGSEKYAAPEQYGFFQSDARTDIYSLGILFHFLLTDDYPQNVEYVGDYHEVINKMISFDPRKRYSSAKEVKQAILREPGFHKYELKDYILPGFRTRKIYKMIPAALYYILSVILVLPGHTEGNSVLDDIIVNSLVVILLWLIVFFVTNYMDLWKHCLFHNHEKKAVRMIGIILSAFILYSMIVVIVIFVDVILEQIFIL